MEFNEEIDEENDSPQFLNFDNMSTPSKNDQNEIKVKSKLSLKVKLIIFSIILIIILLIILIIYNLSKSPKDCQTGYYLPDDSKSKCEKCSVDNCDKCSGTKESNICSSCFPNYIPFYENNILKSCNPCNEGCLTCNETTHKCLECNIVYKLNNGNCIPNYSFKAIYSVDTLNKNVNLIHSSYQNKIKKVIIDGNIQTEINSAYNLKYGEYTVYILLDMNSLPQSMFYGCQDMKEIYFSSLFNNIEIQSMNNMFSGCRTLTSIDFTNFKIKNVTSLENMFNGCSSLKDINISNIDISKVTSMSRMLYECNELELIEFPSIKTKELNNVDQLFYKCFCLKSLDLSNFDTKQVTSFSKLFNECKSLTSLNISNFDTNSVTSLGDMFRDCFSLTSLDLSNFINQKVLSMNYMFYGCSKLTYIDISNFNFSKLNPDLFDKNIASKGTIIVKDEKATIIIESQIKNWNIISKN